MDHARILAGTGKPLPIYTSIVACFDDINRLPDLVEPIYLEAQVFDEETLDHLRFALVRVQVYADIHRYEDMEHIQKVKYVAQVLEKVIFGSLLLEREPQGND
jgi:hypothetical protein